jgi:anthranilate phosphoribosyltransferase
MILRDLLRVLGNSRDGGRNLTRDEAYRGFAAIFAGTESEIQVGAFLTALRWKSVSVEELTGFARAARDRATLPCEGMAGLVCVCPPHDGFDQVPPLEVAACLIAAAAGARVLLITDRSVPPKRGLTGACVLEELGLSMTWDPSEAESWVTETRFGTIAAAGMLPALLGLRRVRGDLAVRTPLNTVEKLLAPSSAAVVLGAQGGAVLGTAVEVMAGLGHPRGIAIQGLEGGVVPGVLRRTRGIELSGEHQVPLSVEPSDFGLNCDQNPELPMFGPPEEGQGTGDNPAMIRAAGDMTRALLLGESGPARCAALLSSAVILKAAGRCMTIAEGVDAATNALDSGGASRILEDLRGRVL